MRKRRSCCAALRFSIFPFPCSVFFSSTPSGRSQVGVVRRANPLRYLSATICTGSTWVRTELDCIRWHNRPFSAIQQFPLAQRHSRVRKRVTQDPKRLQQTARDCRRCNSNNQSIVTDICHVSQANFPCCSWPATATWLAFLCNKHVVKMSIAFSGCAGF